MLVTRMVRTELPLYNWFGLKPVIAPLLARPGFHALARPLLPARWLRRLPVDRPGVDYLMEGGRITLLDPMRDHVAKDIYWGGGKPISAADRRVLRYIERTAKEADVFLDIGSYSGLFALIAARANPQIKSVAYEIVPENHAAILRNIDWNGLPVEVRLCGLADQPGQIVMPDSYGTFSHPTSISLDTVFDDGVEVPVTTLDAEAYSGRLLIKIDVEGFERQVIDGGARTIAASRPDIICEFLVGSEGADAVTSLLRPLGYRFFASREAGFDERDSIVPLKEAKDWLLTTGEP